MATLATLIDTHGIDVLDHLSRDMDVPVNTGLQRQGDVIVIPGAVRSVPQSPIPAGGLPVVRGENGGNTHALVGTGNAETLTPSPTDLDVAYLFVPEGAEAFLAHPEHGYLGIGPGEYTIRRQREQADELRMVAD